MKFTKILRHIWLLAEITYEVKIYFQTKILNILPSETHPSTKLLKNPNFNGNEAVLCHCCNNAYKNSRPHLVKHLKHMFSVFKQHYTHFHTLFHSHVFQKNTNNITQTPLPNGPLISHACEQTSIHPETQAHIHTDL